jgi:hypothetical protein
MASWKEAFQDARIPVLAVAVIWLLVVSALWLT